MCEDNGGEGVAEGRVRLVVDEAVCIGIGQCEMLEPGVFRLDDDSGLAQVTADSALDGARAAVVIDRCPSGAIAAITDELGTDD